jgi:hypothetical protein
VADALSAALSKRVERGGRVYVFQRPSVRQLTQIDVLAARYRESLPVAALSYGVGLSDMRAMLNVMCQDPKTVARDPDGFDFGDLMEDDFEAIYAEVSEWLASFRRPVADASAGVGD